MEHQIVLADIDFPPSLPPSLPPSCPSVPLLLPPSLPSLPKPRGDHCSVTFCVTPQWGLEWKASFDSVNRVYLVSST